MIVVMPTAFPRPVDRPMPTLDPPRDAAVIATTNNDAFPNELIQELIPFIETWYRAERRSSMRAIAGLSNGGDQALSVITTHPDQFELRVDLERRTERDDDARLRNASGGLPQQRHTGE